VWFILLQKMQCASASLCYKKMCACVYGRDYSVTVSNLLFLTSVLCHALLCSFFFYPHWNKVWRDREHQFGPQRCNATSDAPHVNARQVWFKHRSRDKIYISTFSLSHEVNKRMAVLPGTCHVTHFSWARENYGW